LPPFYTDFPEPSRGPPGRNRPATLAQGFAGGRRKGTGRSSDKSPGRRVCPLARGSIEGCAVIEGGGPRFCARRAERRQGAAPAREEFRSIPQPDVECAGGVGGGCEYRRDVPVRYGITH